MKNNLGKILHESQPSTWKGRFVGLLFLTITIMGVVLILIEGLWNPNQTFSREHFLFISILMIGGIFVFIKFADSRLRIYEKGLSGPARWASYVPLWPKPILLQDIIGYKISKKFDSSLCSVLLYNGKVIKIFSDSFDKKTMKIFKENVLNHIKRLSDDEFFEQRRQLKKIKEC